MEAVHCPWRAGVLLSSRVCSPQFCRGSELVSELTCLPGIRHAPKGIIVQRVKFPWCLQGRVPGISDESDLTAKFKFRPDPSGLNGQCRPLTTEAEDGDVGGKSPGRQDERPQVAYSRAYGHAVACSDSKPDGHGQEGRKSVQTRAARKASEE